jgi:dTDP-4-amino-4,6-dideoxygalactose transaminase
MLLQKTIEVPLLDLAAQLNPIRDEIMAAIARVVDSQKFILGEEVQQVEERLAEYCGTRYGIGCASGSDALLLALKALGIGPGDEVATVPFSFFATAGAIALAGATPVFVDVEPETFNIDVNKLENVIAKHPKVKAILPVHLFGGCADMDALNQIAASRNLPVIEDAAQSIGAEYRGRRAGSLGTIGCFSFYPTKNLGAFGDGGLCTTSDKALAERLRALRVHGRTGTYYHQWVGVASRLDAIQAAILGVKLNYLDGWSDGRARNAALYQELMAGRDVPVILPRQAAYQTRHIYHQFVVRCLRDRDGLEKHLKANGVGCEIYYPLSLHQQPCFAGLGHAAGAFPVSEDLARTVLALPIHSGLGPEQIEFVAGLIRSFYA